MPLRTYSDREGDAWRVWLVTPSGGGVSMLDPSYRDGWLCFERVDGTDRRRLALTDVPAAWEALPDERLDLLRRMAAPVGRRIGPTTGTDAGDTSAIETEQRDARSSGPKSVISGDEDDPPSL